MPRALSSPAAALLLLGLALSGCSETFTPASVIEDRRVLALVAEPPELDGSTPGATTTVRAVEAAPLVPPPLPAGTDTLTRRWSFCPFTLGAAAGYACAVPQCEVPLAAGAGGAVEVAPVTLAAACLADPAVVLPPDLAGGALPDRVEVLVRYRVVALAAGNPAAPEVVLREAVQRIPVWTRTPSAPLNASPAFAADAVTVGNGLAAAVAVRCDDPADLAACPVAGTLRRSGVLRVLATVDRDTIEDYAVGSRTATETFALTFFTTAGRFDEDRGAATRDLPGVAVGLQHQEVPAGTADALLWVVLRDLRGGQAVEGPFRLAVEP